MENQIDVGDQNTQQIGQNSMNQPTMISEKPKLNYWMISSGVLAILVLILFGYIFFNLKSQGLKEGSGRVSLPSPTVSISNQPEGTKRPSTITNSNVYKNSTFGVSVIFPKEWFGPEVNEYKDGFWFEVGTDKVYPYGTDRLDRKYDKKNSYYISMQYTKKPQGTTTEEYRKNQPWLEGYLPLLTMKDGETKTDLRSKLIRVKQVNIENYKGVEYISTLSETAQTEWTYAREVFIINDNYDTIRIQGSPNNVEVASKSEWKTDYQQIDEANLSSFRDFVNSISF